MQFSSQAWQNIDHIYRAISTMPFVKELESGSLNKQIFQHYMIQDAIYLGELGAGHFCQNKRTNCKIKHHC